MPSEITGLNAARQNARSISLQTCCKPFWITASVIGSRMLVAARFIGCAGDYPPALQLVPVHDETLVLADLVVERAARRVRRVSQPVHARASFPLRRLVDREDQLAADAFAAQVLDREEILQVADVVQSSRAPMK